MEAGSSEETLPCLDCQLLVTDRILSKCSTDAGTAFHAFLSGSGLRRGQRGSGGMGLLLVAGPLQLARFEVNFLPLLPP